mgnify:CR=1 FL=1
MRIAKEYVSNSQTFSNLEVSKIYLLMELPTEEREEFRNKNDLKNMSARDIKGKIKEHKRNSEIWKIVDKEPDVNKYDVPIDSLKPLPNHEILGKIRGKNYINFLSSIQKYGITYPIVITRDMMIVDGHERVRACKDLGWETIPAVYLSCQNEKNLKLEDLLLHMFFIYNMHSRSSIFYLSCALDECYFGNKEKAKYYMDKFINEGEQIDKEMDEWYENALKIIEEERKLEQKENEEVQNN